MKVKISVITAFFFVFFIAFCPRVLGQANQVIIIADLSGYMEKLPTSSHPIWEGTDTLVPLTVNGSVPKAMGAEYIVFPFRLEGDSLSPNSDDKRKRPYLWRTKATIHQQIYTWQFTLNKPCIVRNNSILGGDYLVLPGDSIHISYEQGRLVFTGKGAVKLQTQHEMAKVNKNTLYPTGDKYPKNLSRFLVLNSYLNEQITTALQILDSHKSNITQYEYDWLKAYFLSNTEYSRWLYFYVIPNPAYENKRDSLPYSTNDLVKVWDSTMYQSDATWFRSDPVQNLPGIGGRGYMKSFISTELLRNSGFILGDSIANQQVFKKMAYYKIKSDFTGLFRERLLCYFINEEFIQEMGSYSWITQSILQDYYATPSFAAYKKWIRERENEHQYLSQGKNGGAPLFNLTDAQGNTFSKKSTDGKFTIINFWCTVCEPSARTAKELSKLQQQFKNDPKVVFLNVSVDSEEQWKKSIREGKYVPREGVQLYTGGIGTTHEMIKDFHVTSIPAIRMYDHTGRIIIDTANPFASTFSSKQMLAVIGGNRVKNFKDGPYVFHEKYDVQGYYIENDTAARLTSISLFPSATDQPGKNFMVKLQKKHETVPSTYVAPEKMLVLSDIEGNFGPFRQLLQANGVMDQQYNWTFGKGHLIFAGDMFDRGNQVTECLWLIYALEEKAKVAGGMVHFILGNHEIMNLQGDHRYVQDKYHKSASLIGKTLTALFNEDSELGRWLRTKNIVEKIGDMLFTHGGISRELNQLPITIEEINQLARLNYGNRKDNYGNEKINTIMSAEVGPFWYRDYYNGLSIENVVDSTLQKFQIKHIVTGHTIVADTISVHHSRKVINTDTRHAGGNSEALLVEGRSFYRVSATGHRILLFKREDGFMNETSSRIH